jgi:hypothetical protein
MKRKIGIPAPLLVSLLLGLVHGCVYVWLMPPWQHYDEPTHFEYAWLIANRLELPNPGDYDPRMRRMVAESMIASGFFDGLGYLPDLQASDGNIWIGDYSQLDEPPGYYLLISLPLRIVQNQAIEFQLHTARFVSVMLLLVSIVACYGFVCELTLPDSPYRWLLPAGIAMLPGYVEMMSGVNNDAAAAAGMGVVLWGGVRLICRGFSWKTAAWSGISALACLLLKETSYTAVPIWFLAVFFSVFRNRWRRSLAWILLGAGVVGFGLAAIGWGDALFWYRTTYQKQPTSVMSVNAPVGGSVFQLKVLAGDFEGGDIYQLNQLVPNQMWESLRGQPLTIGAWMWADMPVQVYLPILTSINTDRGANQAVQKVELSSQPRFYAFQASIPDNAASLRVQLNSHALGDRTSNYIYLDGLVIADGIRPLEEAPSWDDVNATSGSWGGAPFTNLIRNGSAEVHGPRFYPWIDHLATRILPDRGRLSLVLYAIQDTRVTGDYFKAAALNLLQTFWGRFGWGHILLAGKLVYQVLAIATLTGLLGGIAILRRRLNSDQKAVLAVLGFSLLLVWGGTIFRGVFYLFHMYFIPGARYAYPVLVPTLGWLCYGWWSITTLGKNPSIKYKNIVLGIMAVSMLFLDVWSIMSILRYYAG